MALVLKKLVSTSSVVVPNLRRSPNHPRHFIAEVGSTLKEVSRRIVFGCPSNIAPRFANRLLNCFPHTLRVTAKVNDLKGGDMDTTLGTSMKFSLNIPGIEKITETRENLYVFIDMGLHKNLVLNDLETFAFNSRLVKDIGLNNLLATDGFVQKLGIRRYYTAIVPLPPNIKPATSHGFFILPENGGLVVTIPKLVTGSSSSSVNSNKCSPNLAVRSATYPHYCVDAVESFQDMMREMMEDKRFTTVDFKMANSDTEIHGHLRLAVKDYDKNSKVFLRGWILLIIGDDGVCRHHFSQVPTTCFRSSEVVAIKRNGEIKVIFPLTTEEEKHDVQIVVEVPFV